MLIRDRSEHRKLPDGVLVRDANGELYKAHAHHYLNPDTTRSADRDETWLWCWSDEYASQLRDDSIHDYGERLAFPLEVVETVPAPLGSLTEEERRYLAVHATYEANRQDDFRYWDKDPGERTRLKARWLAIADALHPNPWGDPRGTDATNPGHCPYHHVEFSSALLCPPEVDWLQCMHGCRWRITDGKWDVVR